MRRGFGNYGAFPGPDLGVNTGAASPLTVAPPPSPTVPNVYDSYLQMLADHGQSATQPDPAAPAPAMHEMYPSLFPVPGYQRFDFGSSIQAPAVGAGDTVIMSFACPFGWDGVILLISHNYFGTGFVQGSGSIQWRLLIDGRAVKNYDNILFEMGNLVSPRTTEIPIYAGQLFQYVVSVITADVSVGVGTQVIATANGRFWPRSGS